MIDSLKEISKDQLLTEVQKCADSRSRFVTGVCNDMGGQLEVTYFFIGDPAAGMFALRFAVGKDEEVPSMTGISIAFALAENEMKELFGLKVTDIAIDFGGHMLLSQDSPALPMLKSEAQKATAKKGDK